MPKKMTISHSLAVVVIIGALILASCSGGHATATGTTTTTAPSITTSTAFDFRNLPGHTIANPSDAAGRAAALIDGKVNSSLNPAKPTATDDDINAAGANVALLVSQDASYRYSPTLHFSFKPGDRTRFQCLGCGTNTPAEAASELAPIVIVTDGHQTICASFDLGDDRAAIYNSPDTSSCR